MGNSQEDTAQPGAQLKAGTQEKVGGAAAAGANGISQAAGAQAQSLGPTENLQSVLLGPPKHSGLTTFEYAVDSQLRYYCVEAKPENVDRPSVERYQRIFHRDTGFSRANSNSNSHMDGTKTDDWKTSTAGGSSINRKNI